MVIIGGIGTLVGPIVGAFLVYLASEWMREIGLPHGRVRGGRDRFRRFLPRGPMGSARHPPQTGLARPRRHRPTTERRMPRRSVESVVKSLRRRGRGRTGRFAVNDGEIVGLIGPNGSGKTTRSTSSAFLRLTPAASASTTMSARSRPEALARRVLPHVPDDAGLRAHWRYRQPAHRGLRAPRTKGEQTRAPGS